MKSHRKYLTVAVKIPILDMEGGRITCWEFAGLWWGSHSLAGFVTVPLPL